MYDLHLNDVKEMYGRPSACCLTNQGEYPLTVAVDSIVGNVLVFDHSIPLIQPVIEEIPFEEERGVIVFEVNGMIRPETRWWSQTSGVEALVEQILLAAEGNSSRAVLKLNSHGGFPERLKDFSAAVDVYTSSRLPQKRPFDAFIEDFGQSAGYWMAVFCDNIHCNPLANVGGLGVYTILEDTTKMMEEIGITLTVVSDNDNGAKGKLAAGIVDESVVGVVEKGILSASELFRQDVVGGRKLSRSVVDKLFTGQSWLADEAQELGLVNGVLPWFKYIEMLEDLT